VLFNGGGRATANAYTRITRCGTGSTFNARGLWSGRDDED
jgi:hypothetical protein